MANKDDLRGGESPWGSPPRGGNGSGRGQKPPSIDEVVKKIQSLINKFIPEVLPESLADLKPISILFTFVTFGVRTVSIG